MSWGKEQAVVVSNNYPHPSTGAKASVDDPATRAGQALPARGVIYLTQQNCDGHKSPRQAVTEVTPEMIRLGVQIYWEWERSENYRVEHLIETLYRRLQDLAGRSQPVPPCDKLQP